MARYQKEKHDARYGAREPIHRGIHPARRSRYKTLLANPKRREAFLDRFNHGLDYMPSAAQAIPGSQHSLDGVARLLRQRGVRDTDPVYVISDTRDLDGTLAPALVALASVFAAGFGSVVDCIEGELAYYHPEEPGDGILLALPPRLQGRQDG